MIKHETTVTITTYTYYVTQINSKFIETAAPQNILYHTDFYLLNETSLINIHIIFYMNDNYNKFNNIINDLDFSTNIITTCNIKLINDFIQTSYEKRISII